MDRKETEMLKKEEGYQSKFWAYLDENVAVIAKISKNFNSKARSKERLPIDDKKKARKRLHPSIGKFKHVDTTQRGIDKD